MTCPVCGRAVVMLAYQPYCSQTCESQAPAEEGRRLASEREDLIAVGANPAELIVPLHPMQDPVRANGRWCPSCYHDPHPREKCGAQIWTRNGVSTCDCEEGSDA